MTSIGDPLKKRSPKNSDESKEEPLKFTYYPNLNQKLLIFSNNSSDFDR